jgi:hypothetical protein
MRLTPKRKSEKQWTEEGRYDDDVPSTVSPGDDEYVSDSWGYVGENGYSQSTFDNFTSKIWKMGIEVI